MSKWKRGWQCSIRFQEKNTIFLLNCYALFFQTASTVLGHKYLSCLELRTSYEEFLGISFDLGAP